MSKRTRGRGAFSGRNGRDPRGERDRRSGRRAGDWDDSFGSAREGRSRDERARERDERRHAKQREAQKAAAPAVVRVDRDPWQASILFSAFTEEAPALACGGCRNWSSHQEPGGRGSCDHPGSGFSFPYADTPACPFYEARRGR